MSSSTEAVILYGDVNLNIIDGSSVWLVSAAEVLSKVFDRVDIILKAPIENERLISSVSGIPNVWLHEPPGRVLTAAEAAQSAEHRVQRGPVDAIVVRGLDACGEFAKRPTLAKTLYSYVTDLPYPLENAAPQRLELLNDIATASRGMFSQTEASRSYLEAVCPAAAGKTSLMRPMIPATQLRTRDHSGLGTAANPLRLVYSGKFAKPWKTLEMLELPRELEKRGVHSELVVVGDKYNRDSADPSWVSRMRDALTTAANDPHSGVRWLGALEREKSLEEIARSDIGIGWRSRELDSSLEISTKALEYSLSGTVPVINRTVDHEALFGADYPFFVTSDTTAANLAELLVAKIGSLDEAVRRAADATSAYTMDEAAVYLREVFRRKATVSAIGSKDPGARPLKLVVASHDMKFMGELMQFFQQDGRFEVRVDEWKTLHTHDEKKSTKLAQWADIVFCEWAGPALRWYSVNAPARTRLYSRLHRFEMNGAWMDDVAWDNVNGLVFVSSFIRDQVVQRFGIEESKTHIIANAIDTADFDRPKLPNAQFHVGMVGYVPFLKRPDRAVDLLSMLLEADSRYTLHLKGRLPWDYSYEWNKALQKQAYLELFDRISRDPLLRKSVVVEPFSADIASWQRGMGFTLSPSSLESFHLAPAEGMASGSIPVVWEREGARQIFGDYVVASLGEAVERITALRESAAFEKASAQAKSQAQKWDSQVLTAQWAELFLGHSESDGGNPAQGES